MDWTNRTAPDIWSYYNGLPSLWIAFWPDQNHSKNKKNSDKRNRTNDISKVSVVFKYVNIMSHVSEFPNLNFFITVLMEQCMSFHQKQFNKLLWMQDQKNPVRILIYCHVNRMIRKKTRHQKQFNKMCKCKFWRFWMFKSSFCFMVKFRD